MSVTCKRINDTIHCDSTSPWNDCSCHTCSKHEETWTKNEQASLFACVESFLPSSTFWHHQQVAATNQMGPALSGTYTVLQELRPAFFRPKLRYAAMPSDTANTPTVSSALYIIMESIYSYRLCCQWVLFGSKCALTQGCTL
jgi:hypothetical protein